MQSYNMGFLVDFLLFAVVLTEVKTLIPPWTFIALDTASSGGAFSLTDWTWATMPSADFCLAFWIYVDPVTTQGSHLVYIASPVATVALIWYSDDTIRLNRFSFDNAPLSISRTSYTPKLWLHVVLTTNGDAICEILSLRVGNQNQRCKTASLPLLSTAQIFAPHYSSGPFKVKSM